MKKINIFVDKIQSTNYSALAVSNLGLLLQLKRINLDTRNK